MRSDPAMLAGRVREAGAPRARRRPFTAEEALAWTMVAPWVVGFLLWHLGPMVASAALSLTDWPLLAAARSIGLENYRTRFSADPLFFQARKVTTGYAVTAVPLQIV